MNVDPYQQGLRQGYRAGELERIALATANSDLRSELLAAYQQLEILEKQNTQLHLELLTAHAELLGLYDE